MLKDISRVSLALLAVAAFSLLAACSANSGATTHLVTTQIPAAPVVNFTLAPQSLDVGQTAKATWTTTGATSCSATGAWSGALALSNSNGTAVGPVATSGTYVYGVVCTGAGGSTAVDQTLMVGAVPVPSVRLTLTPSAMAPGKSSLITWSTSNATSCTATGVGVSGWTGNQATQSAKGVSTGAIATPGEYVYNLSCSGAGGTTESSSILTVSAAAPAPQPSVSFNAQPASIEPGQTTSLSWSTADATSCAASGGSGADAWSGAQPTSSSGFSTGPIASAGTYSYTLTCTGPGGNSAKSLNVAVSAASAPPPVHITIGVTPAQMVAGGSASLDWSATNATACVASGSWSGNKPLLGTAVGTGTLTAPAVYTYTLVCSGAGGSASGTASLTVVPAAASVTSFAALPSAVQTGESVDLAWTTSSAETCAATGGTGSDHWRGTVSTTSSATPVGPYNTAGTYVYTLRCSGTGGAGAPRSLSVVVTAAAPPNAAVSGFSASPSTIQSGQAAALSWTTTNATACTAGGGAGSSTWSGLVGTSGSGFSTGALSAPGSYIFTLNCTGPGGAGTPASVAVNVASAPPATAISSFTVSPSSIPVGQAATLAWSSTAANSCTAGGGTGSWMGSVGTSSTGFSTGTMSSAGTYTYTLTCTGAGGASTPSSAILNVSSAPASAASVGLLTATPSTLIAGQSTTLAWSSVNAVSCTASGGTGSDGWSGSAAVASGGRVVGPLAAGTYIYTLNCTGSGGSAGPSSVSVTATAPPTSPPTIDVFTATPSTTTAGQSVSLAWSTSGATACSASGGTGTDGWTGTMATASNGTSTGVIAAPNSYTYTLTCTGPGGTSGSSSVIVNVNAVPPPAATITSLAATPSSLVAGQSTSLAWSSSSATGCSASGGSGADAWVGSVAISSSGTSIGPLTTAGNFLYTLTCTGPGGNSAATSVAVDVTNAPPLPTIGSLTAAPTTLQAGQSTVLSWSSNDATSCTGSAGSGSDGWSGNLPVSSSGFSVGPITTTGIVTYTLTCSGAGGTSLPSSVSVDVTATPAAPAISNFEATPSALQVGSAATLSWGSSNADSCTATGGTGSDGWSGSMPVTSTGRSTGAIGAAGTYIYTLTCSGAGGDIVSTAMLTVSSVPPAATIDSFTASPNTLLVGQSTQLSWTTSAASACTASGGTGADGWNGSRNVSSVGTTIGPINSAGNYIYTLSCTGPGGPSAPASIDVTVSAPTPASILTFTASPSSLYAGGTASLAWTTAAATSCVAGGGTGGDGWNGTVGTSSTGTAVGPLSSTGSITYTLACSGNGGASAPSSTSVTVNAVIPAQPIVTLTASSTNVQPGSSLSLSWSSNNATSCSASGGSASEWQGSKPISSSGTLVGPVSVTPGIYSYTLTCSGAGGSGSSTLQVTVMSPNSTDCGIGVPTMSLVAPAASATATVNGGIGGLLCIGCTVNNPQNLVDTSTTNYASMHMSLAVLGSTSLQVNGTTSFPAGRQLGFVVAEGTGLLNLSLLAGITVQTLVGNTVQESATTGDLLTLQALGLLSVDPDAGFIGFTATKPFDSVAIVAGSLAALAADYRVYEACVALQ